MKSFEKKPIDVIFCGLLRTQKLFEKSILDLIELRKKGFVNRIIFSTWENELKEDMRCFLKKMNIIIVESKEPEKGGIGNIWCQMKSFEEGMKKSDKNLFVLKTRTDVHIDKRFIIKLCAEREKVLRIDKSLPNGNIFKYKIWVPWFEISKPFFMGDECFFGHSEDIKKLINYEEKYDEEYKLGPGINHIRRFVNPFLKDYPFLINFVKKYNPNDILKNYLNKFSKRVFDLRKIALLRSINENKKIRKMRKRLNHQDYLKSLAYYYSILWSHFYIDSSSFKNQIVFREWSTPNSKLDLDNFELNFSKMKVYKSKTGQIICYDMDFLERILNKKMKKTKVFLGLTKEIGKFYNEN
jgi:hypothetical protein